MTSVLWGLIGLGVGLILHRTVNYLQHRCSRLVMVAGVALVMAIYLGISVPLRDSSDLRLVAFIVGSVLLAPGVLALARRTSAQPARWTSRPVLRD